VLNNDPDQAEAIRRVRVAAADEAERLLSERLSWWI